MNLILRLLLAACALFGLAALLALVVVLAAWLAMLLALAR